MYSARTVAGVLIACIGVLAFVVTLGTSGCGTGGNSCLAAGTQVATPLGAVAIEDLRVGDRVWSVDSVQGTLVAARVVAIRTARRSCLSVTTASGRRVVATRDHPFYAPREGGYLKLVTMSARSDPRVLVRGETLVAERVTSIRPVLGLRTVYDLTLDGRFHNFLANGILVHNKSPPAPSTTRYQGTLEGAQQVPPVVTAAMGTVAMTLDNNTNTFDMTITIGGAAITVADVTGFHIHVGALGVNGGPIVDLGTAGMMFVDMGGGTIVAQGTGIAFPPANLVDLLMGNTYVNVHTMATLGGEVRAQLQVVP